MIPSDMAAKLIALAVLAIVAAATFVILGPIERRRSSRIADLQKLLARAGMSKRGTSFLPLPALAGIALTILAYALSKRAEVAWIALLLGFVFPYSYIDLAKQTL
jgi:hypothetical protein